MKELIREEDFDNLFNEMISLVMKNNDQGKRDIVEAISDIYEIKEYIPEITLYEKGIKQRLLVFRYNTDPSTISGNYYTLTSSHVSNDNIKTVIKDKKVDLDFTLRSFYTFFSLYYYKNETDDLIDKATISEIILPAIEKLLAYITAHKD